VGVFADYRPMLEACHGNLDLVVIPTPIGLHAEMHDAVTARGLPAYVEKPPTLDYAELERMIAADRRSPKASLVGFNFIIEKPRLALKERLLSGEFGIVRGGGAQRDVAAAGELFCAQRLGRPPFQGWPRRGRFLLRQRVRPLRP